MDAGIELQQLAGRWIISMEDDGAVALPRWLEQQDHFDAAGAVNHETTEVADEEGASIPAELWTTCYTPRELVMLAGRAGLVAEHVWSVTPGAYERTEPTTESHEFLLLARRPPAPGG